MGFGRYMDGCGNCMKYSLFFVNLLIFIGGLVVIGLGIYIAVDRSFGTQILGTNLYIGAIYIVIAAAVVVSLIACFGCFGAAQEVRCMLVTYFIIVFLIFITMLVGGILLYVFRHDVEGAARKGMNSSIHSYHNDKSVKEAWDEIQTAMKCCGIDGVADWNGQIPDSCCKPVIEGVQNRCHQASPNLYHEGCIKAWPDFIKKNAAIVGGIGIGVACVMVLGMVFSCALFNLID